MAHIGPATLSERDFRNAMAAFAQALPPDRLVTDERELTGFGDPFALKSANEFTPGAALLPRSVEEVQAIVRIANECRVPLWTTSQGRNNGYGGSAPRVRGSVVVCLKNMNRVLEVDETSAFAVVEPGVSFFDLHNHLRANGSKLWMSVPDLGWGSVVGNTLDHGFGYTPYGDHMANQCGLEVVLPNGELLRTGMGAMPNSKAWHIYRRGFGPSVDGLFGQSSLGVVTKMGVWLMPQPECYMPGWLTLRREEDLYALLDILRPLLIKGTIPGLPMMINAVCAASALSSRSQWTRADEPLASETIERISQQPGLGQWVMRFALYGDEPVVEHQRRVVTEAFMRIPGAQVNFSKYRGDELPRLDNPHERVQAGIPSIDLNNMTKWYGGEEGGHIGFSSVLPVTGEDAKPLLSLVKLRLHEAGLDYSGVLVANRRTLIHVCLVVFDTKNEAQTRTAYEVCKGMVEPAAKLGYGEYRAHLDFMDLVAAQYDFNDHSLRRFNETLKDALDPRGILSPGKQGIWPRAMRPG